MSPKAHVPAIPGCRLLESSFDIRLDAKLFVPDRSQPLEFRVEPGNLNGTVQLYLTGEVFSIDGRRVAVLFKSELRTFQRGVSPRVDT